MKKKELEHIQEVGAVSAIISDAILQQFYEKAQIGFINTAYTIADWAIEFIKKHKRTNWEKVQDKGMKPLSKYFKSEEGGEVICWDDAVIDFAWYKYEQYCKNH
jgi:hypothetical protein